MTRVQRTPKSKDKSTFGDLIVGDYFDTEFKSVYIKVDDQNAVCLVDGNGAVKVGDKCYWDKFAKVIYIKRLDFYILEY